MRIGTLRRGRGQEQVSGVTGTARLDRRTKNLTKRLRPGDVAVIDHVDLDRVSAEALVGCGVSAVLNVARSISGRYPNQGPEMIVAAGIPLVDDVDPEVLTRVRDGERLRLEGATLYRDAREGRVIDVVIGERFRRLSTPAELKKSLGRQGIAAVPASPAPVPTPSC